MQNIRGIILDVEETFNTSQESLFNDEDKHFLVVHALEESSYLFATHGVCIL